MAELDFRLLNTELPYQIATSFQRGMDEATLRKRKQLEFEQAQQQRDVTNQYNQRQQELLGMHYQNDKEKILADKADKEFKRKASQRTAEQGRLIANSIIGAPAFKVVDTGDEFDIDLDEQLYNEAMKNMMPVTADQQNPMMERAKKFGISPESMQYVASMAEINPVEAAKFLGKTAWERQRLQLKQEMTPQKQPTPNFDDYGIMRELGVTDPNNMTQEQWARFNAKKNEGRKAGAASVSVNSTTSLPSLDEAGKTAGKEYGKYAQDALSAAQSAYDISNDVDMVVEGLQGMGGGPVAEFKAWAGRFMPAGTDWANMASMNDLAKTVQVKLAPTMRAAGSGATSDFEMKAFMAAIPSLSSTEQGRMLMAKYARRIADRSQARAEVINSIEKEGRLPTPKEIAQRMEAKVGKSFFDSADRAYFGMKGNAAPSKPAAPTTGKLTPAEQKELDDLRRRFNK